MWTLLLALLALQAAPPSAEAKGAATPSYHLPPKCSLRYMSDGIAEKESREHANFPEPIIDYPYGSKTRGDWGFSAALHVDVSGRVTCFSVEDYSNITSGRKAVVELTRPRREALARISAAGFKPFLRHGKATEGTVSVSFREQELPQETPPPIAAPLDSVRISLSRNGCYKDSCANYSVSVMGDGRVRYEGTRGPGLGVHEHTIPVAQVRALLDSLLAKKLWGARPEYDSPDWEQPTFVLEFEIGGQTRRIVDVAGDDVGMPVAMREFQDEVDLVAGTAVWTEFTMQAVDQLQAEGFDFRSKAGSDLVHRIFWHGKGGEDVLLRLLDLGVSPTVRESTYNGVTSRITPLEDAIEVGYERVVAALIARGALLKDGKLDPALVDHAFARAIFAGRLGPVRMIWDATTPSSRPSLTYAVVETLPHYSVLLRLHHEPEDSTAWQGYEIVQWFAGMGADLKVHDSDGDTLLHIAANADDLRLVRYLLEQGLDPSARGQYGYTPLDKASSEAVMLALLEAGANPQGNELMGDPVKYAKYYDWPRVLAWLEAHPQQRQ